MKLVSHTSALLALCLSLFGATAAQATDIVFSSNPFAGSPADPNDGVRTIFAGNQLALPSFDVQTDRFVFETAFFNVPGPLSFANSLTANLATSGLNMIVVQDTGPGFAAGTAANLIANAVTTDGAGFFVYSNVGLGVNRLVYSTNLNLNTADLSVLARINSPTGADALSAIPTFSNANFALAPVPEPSEFALMFAGLALIGAVVRQRRGPTAG